MGSSPGEPRRPKLPHCVCQQRDALPAPGQDWQEIVQTAGFLSARAEQMFPARSHGCPEQLTAHTLQGKGSQGAAPQLGFGDTLVESSPGMYVAATAGTA